MKAKRILAIGMAITMVLFFSSNTLFAAELEDPTNTTSEATTSTEDENTTDTTEAPASTEDENTTDTTEAPASTEDGNMPDTTEAPASTEDENTTDTTEAPTSTEDGDMAETTEDSTPAVGDIITVGSYTYKITAGNTVTLKGFAEGVTKSKVIVQNQITYNGTTYTVTKVGVRAFKNNNSITEVLIRKGTVTIGQGAFFNCKNLSSVIIKTGVTTIGKNAFRNCPKLRSIIITSTALTTIKSTSFKKINPDAVIAVKTSKVRNLIKPVVPDTVLVVTM